MEQDTAALAREADSIHTLYQQLLPVMRAIHKKYPESKYEVLHDASQSDGFCRMIDLVPNMEMGLRAPLYVPKRAGRPPMQENIARTEDIFAQSRAILARYAHDPLVTGSGALFLNDLLEDTLLEAYKTYDAITPTTDAVHSVTTERLGTPTPAKDARRG